MRIYQDCLEMAKEVERDLHEMGVMIHPQTVQDKDVSSDPAFDCKELMAYQYMLVNPHKMIPMISFLGLDTDSVMEYIRLELLDRMDNRLLNPGHSWRSRAEVWEEYLHDGIFAYTYNDRVRQQIGWLIRRAQLDPDSRQLVLTIYDQHTDIMQWGGGGRIPCSMYYHFMVREEPGADDPDKAEKVLWCHYHMRSCDFYTHFPVDICLALGMTQEIAGCLDLRTGPVVHNIDSLHMFRKDWEKRGEVF